MVNIVLDEIKEISDNLVKFLRDKIEVQPTVEGNKLYIGEGEGEPHVPVIVVKTYLKRFLHLNGMRKSLRIYVEKGTIRLVPRKT